MLLKMDITVLYTVVVKPIIMDMPFFTLGILNITVILTVIVKPKIMIMTLFTVQILSSHHGSKGHYSTLYSGSKTQNNGYDIFYSRDFEHSVIQTVIVKLKIMIMTLFTVQILSSHHGSKASGRQPG
jgi:hypothetical protein